MGTYIWDSYKISEAVISYTIFMNNGKMLPAGVCKVVETDLEQYVCASFLMVVALMAKEADWIIFQ